jgi:phosphoribosylformylglycinamidine synthase
MSVIRVYVEKKRGYAVEAEKLKNEITTYLHIKNIEDLRVVNRYDIEGIDSAAFEKSKYTVFSEPPVDILYEENLPLDGEFGFAGYKTFAVEYLPGQYDQRADSASQTIQLITHGSRPLIKTAKVIAIKGNISDEDLKKIQKYVVNPVDSRIARDEKPATLVEEVSQPSEVPVIKGFRQMNEPQLKKLLEDLELAMDLDDLKFSQNYFQKENRDPTLTELRVLDTYWSDHCRHTTFLTEITDVEFEDNNYKKILEDAYRSYLALRKKIYGDNSFHPINLMDLATIGKKILMKENLISDLDISEEINACSIVIDVKKGLKKEKWLLQFKNETHNHPTEIEPFGGAATCLGGAIRDPLAGRAYVYQAMRITGSGDPRKAVDETLPGKLPQRKITIEAANGYSSYGNQVGLATGFVNEIYHEGYVAKRMEIGAVVGAVKRSHVKRKRPKPGDVVILLGGATGRDGCGGATGSSKAHTEKSIEKASAEVQKGNPPEERKILRLFRKPHVIKMIKRCNDFGAGGVSVAVGEIAKGVTINLDLIPKKYEGLDGTELAISESQERMAVVVSRENAKKFIQEARKENLVATIIAEVTEEEVLRMFWRGKEIVSLKRDFLSSNGAKKYSRVKINKIDDSIFRGNTQENYDIKSMWYKILSDLNIASQKGLVERFDSTVGAKNILMPFGGKYQLTPIEAMVSKIPTLYYDTTTVSIVSYGFNPYISTASPFHGAIYAIVESISRIVATGGDYEKVRLSFQEYFEKPQKDPSRWGKPFAALLGAFVAQINLKIPSIGGKDSMSGTFNNLDVPPTLVSFAFTTADVKNIVSPEFKKTNSFVYFFPTKLNENYIFDWEYQKKLFKSISKLIKEGKVLSASTGKSGGLAEVISKMCFGNKIGFEATENLNDKWLFSPIYGSFVIETSCNLTEKLDVEYHLIGKTTQNPEINIKGNLIPLEEAIEKWLSPLQGVFPYKTNEEKQKLNHYQVLREEVKKSKVKIAKPRVFIPVFYGTNTEYESEEAFRTAGAIPVVKVFVNLTPKDLENSIDEFVKAIKQSQMIYIPGGFSAGDEPEGSGKFIAAVFRNPAISDAVMELLYRRDGLILGICNGFQALIKLGLVPYGEIRALTEDSPTLTFNKIGRHVSIMVHTKIVSNLSPWFLKCDPQKVYTIPVSHGEGRFVAKKEVLESLIKNGQVATQYTDENGTPTMEMPYNPNGSIFAIEGITSPDGRVLGKMGHSERRGKNLYLNIPGDKWQPIFEGGVEYFS